LDPQAIRLEQNMGVGPIHFKTTDVEDEHLSVSWKATTSEIAKHNGNTRPL